MDDLLINATTIAGNYRWMTAINAYTMKAKIYEIIADCPVVSAQRQGSIGLCAVDNI